MDQSSVDRLYSDFRAILDLLDKSEVSLRLTAEEAFRKNLLVAAASYFEKEIKNQVLVFVEKTSDGNEMLVAFVRNKAIERQYHSYFQWDRHNANSFFGLFGEGFKSFVSKQVSADETIQEAIEAFLELGNERNRLIHQDFSTFSLEKNSKEILALYNAARPFLVFLQTSFEAYLQNASTDS